MTDKLGLNERSGLPEEFRVLSRAYPREDWAAHANFNELTQFWLERHGMFRRLMGMLTEGSEAFLDQGNARYVPEVSRYTGMLLEQLHGHHTIEDHHYFPKFAGMDSRLEAAFELLDRDHHALDAHMHGLAQASNDVISTYQAEGDLRVPAGKLLEVQKGFSGFLERHLSDEEEIIVPLILEYGGDFQ